MTALPAVAFAQGGVLGSIVGNVFDTTGMPIQGVKVTAESKTHIGGARVAYTNQEGAFRLPHLQPGIFEVIASAPRMNSVRQKGIRVGMTAPAEVSLVLDVATRQEEVKVVEKAPIVSTKSAAVKEVWDEEFVDNLPLETRTSVEEVVGNAAPGAVYAGERLVRVRGGNTQQNLYLVDGFNLTGLKTVYKSLAAMEVQTAGYGADGAVSPGGLVTMVTKTGSNRYELDINGFHEDSVMRFFQTEADVVPRDMRSYINPNFSGPIIQDKLWFYVNGEARNEFYSRGDDPTGFFQRPPTQQYWNYRGTTKVTYQVNGRNKLQSFTFIDKNYSRNRTGSFNFDRDAQNKRERYGFFTGLTWESLFTDSLFFKTQAGFSQTQENYAPQRCIAEPVACLHDPPVVQTVPQTINMGNHPELRFLDVKALEVVNTLEWFGHSELLGTHDVKLVSRYYTRGESVKTATPGDRIIRLSGATPDRETVYFSNDPRLSDPRYGYFIASSTGSRFTNTLQDTAKVTRHLTLTPGIAITTTSSGNSAGFQVTDGTAITPHFAVAWDATHDGRTVLRGSFNQYVDPDVGRLARHNLGTRVSQECRWNAATGLYDTECRYSGGAAGATVGLPCGPTGVDQTGRPCQQKLRVPRTWEYTFGAEREVIEGLGLGFDYVYRDFTHPYVIKETNRIWNYGGTAVERTGGFRNGRAETIQDLETPDEARRKYVGATFAAHRREGKLKGSFSYTWSKTYGNAFDTEVNAYGDIPPRDMFLWGPMPDDSRHTIKITSTYQWSPWLSTGVLYTYLSGRPYNRWYWNSEVGGYQTLNAPVGSTPGANINDPGDDRALRLPDQQILHMQLRTSLKPLTGQDMELFADIMNVLALRTPTGVVEEDGMRFGQITSQMGPTSVRLGFRFRY